MSFPRYERYKNSGVEWLGEVPEHWKVKRYRTIFRERDERSKNGLETLLSVSAYTGVSPRRDLIAEDDVLMRADSLEGYKSCYSGDLVMNIMLAWNRGLGFSTYEGVVSPAYSVFHVVSDDERRFLHYLVRSNETISYFKAFSSGVIDSRLRLYPDVFASLYCALPDRREQEQIAAFLDQETAKIDALVEQQRRLIALLKEKRQAVISHVVTKGLNPAAPMKEPHKREIGLVPRHWQIVQVRRLISTLEQGWSPQCDAQPASPDEWGILKSGCVNRGTYSESENKALPASMDPIPVYEVREGDVLMSRASGSPELVGSTALVEKTRSKLMISDKIFRIRLNHEVSSRYFVEVFNSAALRSQIEAAISGADGLANNLPQSDLKGFVFPLPALSEQVQISQFLKCSGEEMDSLIKSADESIALLQERRSALISAAVTGKIDVRNYAAREKAAAVGAL